MQNQAAQAYQTTARQTTSPRELEANLLSKSALRLQRIRDDWDAARSDLFPALQFNRKLWNIFLTSVTGPESTLPIDLRDNVANLGVFVMKHSLDTQLAPEARKLDVLININRNLAAGLRANVEAA